jgi:hypothetical protein
VFVMALLASEMAPYYRDDRTPVRTVLQKAETDVKNIPTLIDRADRLEEIAKSWDSVGDKTQAQFAIENAFKLASQLESATADDRLRLLVQAAYKVDPDLADDLASKLDARLPRKVISPINVALEVEKLRSNPSKISALKAVYRARGLILGMTAQKLVQDLATGRGTVFPSAVLAEWLTSAGLYHPRFSIDITHWVIESLHRQSSQAAPQSRLGVFLTGAQFTYELANWISTMRGEGIPEAMHDSFPGLSTKVVSFGTGDVDRAKKWVGNWLSSNVQGYLKICDPYFGPEEIEYLKYVPVDCRVLVVTTDRYLKVGDKPDQIKTELELYWRELTPSALPTVQFVIIPQELEDRFHDRAIITQHCGLDIGQSLNGLGKSRGKITVLSEEDAKDLEEMYVDKILNSATWFMEGVHPTVLFLGG